MPSVTMDQAQSLAQSGTSIRAQLRRVVDRLLTRHRLAERLFLGADGQLTDPAREWLKNLARDNFVEAGGFDIDPRRHAYNEGRRSLALEILRSVHIDTERLGALTRMEREVND